MKNDKKAGGKSEYRKIVNDLSNYMGQAQFDRAYRYMLQNDTHASGSVDRLLTEQMVRLCPETADYLYSAYTPVHVDYAPGSRPELEQKVAQAAGNCASGEKKIERIAAFTAALGRTVSDETLDEMRFGGTEEEIIQRGSDWCTDVARVACAMCQVAGLPARLVMLFDTAQAYSGHVIVEVYREQTWGAVDASTAVMYRHPEGRPATTWDLMRQPDLIETHRRADGTLPAYTHSGQFRGTAISNYFIWRREEYDYTVSAINLYCRSILTMSEQGWPGGLRWLHREDNSG